MQLLKPYFEDFLCLLYGDQQKILDGSKTLRCRNNAHFWREKLNWELAQTRPETASRTTWQSQLASWSFWTFQMLTFWCHILEQPRNYLALKWRLKLLWKAAILDCQNRFSDPVIMMIFDELLKLPWRDGNPWRFPRSEISENHRKCVWNSPGSEMALISQIRAVGVQDWASCSRL